MSKSKKIKIFTSHRSYFHAAGKTEKLDTQKPKGFVNLIFLFFYYVGFIIIKTVNFLKKTIVAGCFHTGNIIISSILSSIKAVKNDFSKTKSFLPKRFTLLFNPQFFKSLGLFFVFAFVGYIGLASLGLVAKGLQIKGKVLGAASLGNQYLSQAKEALGSQDFSQAQNRFALAFQMFSNGQQEFSDSGQALNQLMGLLPQKQDADRLLYAAGLVAKAGQNFVNLELDFKKLNINAAGISNHGQQTSEVFDDISSELLSANSNLTQANLFVSQVNEKSLPGQTKESFVQLKAQLNNASFALNNFSQVFALAKSLLIGKKNVLVMFENNNELRAGGGFMGTYGLLKINDGSLSKINVSSIYDLDGQLAMAIQPPKPLLNVGPRWYLRDSNWFADFPTTAKKISSFYEQEGGETPDMIIALTPNIIVDWLKITGPITLPKYNLTLNSDNFVEQTQAATTLSNNLPTNSPKQILADLVPLLIQQLTEQNKESWPQIIQSLQNNLNNKQIAIYSRDSQIQNQLESFHWTGSLNNTDRDYLSVVSSNLGGTKTDLYVDQEITLNSNIEPDGSVLNELSITRTNKMPKLNETNNLSYIRVYVPLGSKLINNIGFDYKNLDYPTGQNYKIDDDVYNWEKNSVTDNLTGTTIGEESGKTFFGNWLNVEGGESKTVKLVYQLPFKINSIDRYSMLFQKQIGALNSKLNLNLHFSGWQIDWKNFDTNTLNTSDLSSGIIMDKDYFLGLVLEKR